MKDAISKIHSHLQELAQYQHTLTVAKSMNNNSELNETVSKAYQLMVGAFATSFGLYKI